MTGHWGRAGVYRKTTLVRARLVEPGTRVVTVLSDGTVETSRVARAGDQVVTNPTGESYLVDGETFADRYDPTGTPGVYRACGQVLAIDNPTGAPVTITAPWGEEMHGAADCKLAARPDEHGRPGRDRYLVGRAEFDRTYSPVHGSSG